ncbi:glutamine amidotransferase domain-containing protein [Alcanivorax hongdengensis A-11-3]|uniref:Glutamine amidotransferase domain-containing protein n=1 Tax=Alcanivorax hongdengensis A-11-3 TaxID=1177179 RepID=L0WH12_9GAMM|nr:type 1 glutamine amidotransferase [Alcanivorax hongdengensis]EKF75397.1 glutamine amidotransferase domain-containing protein [Alcanivorax hongdengensis A-11-3]
MRIHYLTHVPFEKLGAMEAWFKQHGDRISATRFYHGEALPDPQDLDMLVVMGGPMGADDEERYPWMADEKRFIRACIDANKKVLGVCLGAQLIARVLGAPVTRNAHREIGWFPVQPTGAGRDDPLGRLFGSAPPVLHWHGDTFAIPEGAVHLLRSEGCANQAFRYGERVLGLQFHLELTADHASTLCQECPDDLAPGPFVEARDSMLADTQRFARARELLDQVLNRFLD